MLHVPRDPAEGLTEGKQPLQGVRGTDGGNSDWAKLERIRTISVVSTHEATFVCKHILTSFDLLNELES